MSEFSAILELIIKYPFLRATGKFIEYELNLDSADKESKNIFPEKYKAIIQHAIELVKASVQGKDFDKENYFEEQSLPATFLCVSCDRHCFDCEYLKTLNFYECNACCECYMRCYQKLRDYNSLKLKAKMSAVYYITSKAIISELSSWMRRRFAIREASRYAKMLEKEDDSVLMYIASDLKMKLKIKESHPRYLIHVTSYLRGATKIRDEKRRLINRKLNKGWVEIGRHELVRLIEEILREKLSDADFKHFSELLPDYAKKAILEIKSLDNKISVNLPIKTECFPPCMKKILSDLQKGVNLPHTARFAITAFLLNIGVSVDEIIKIFSSAPDFNEELTRYQVEHIAGQKGKGSEYICPSCDTMKTYNNCVSNCKVASPVTYYIKTIKKHTKKKK